MEKGEIILMEKLVEGKIYVAVMFNGYFIFQCIGDNSSVPCLSNTGHMHKIGCMHKVYNDFIIYYREAEYEEVLEFIKQLGMEGIVTEPIVNNKYSIF